MKGLKVQQKGERATFSVKVIPRAKKNEIEGVEEGVLKVRIAAPPIRGKANEALIEFLAQWLQVRRHQVEISRGQASGHKVITVSKVSAEEIERRAAR